MIFFQKKKKRPVTLLVSTIKVNKFDKESKMISVYNNGKGIPIETTDQELNVRIPEMLLFGQYMITSSDYTSGKNGFGAKIGKHIFSTQFTVETTQKKKYIQLFHNNMSQISSSSSS